MRYDSRCSGALLFLLALTASPAEADWPTHQGNPERTGNVDGQPGPRVPKVLWSYRIEEPLCAGPVPEGETLYVVGQGESDQPHLHALALESDTDEREQWGLADSTWKRPVVAAPAVGAGRIVLGDGRHPDDGAVLRYLDQDGGQVLWQFPIADRLAHLEGTPTIAGDRVVVGAGGAGVVCLDLESVLLEGRPRDLAEAQAIVETRWQEMMARYEEEKQADPEFAIPPNTDLLPSIRPRLLWKQGMGEWHVDAPVAVVENRVIVAISRPDQEQVGERALICLKLRDGQFAWKVPLKLDPLAGPTVAGRTVLVGCSSIRPDPQDPADATGEVVAVDLVTGRVKWRKPVPGAILSAIAATDHLAIATATDGQVRAWDLANGRVRWSYKARNPFFAGPAVVDEVVYAVDLKGIVYALSVAGGRGLWGLNLAVDPVVKAPGQVLVSPVVHDGRIFVSYRQQVEADQSPASAIICIGSGQFPRQARRTTEGRSTTPHREGEGDPVPPGRGLRYSEEEETDFDPARTSRSEGGQRGRPRS